MHVLLHFVDGGDGAAQGLIGRQVEGDGDGWELTLMRNRQRFGGGFEMREGAERDGVA